MRRIQNNRQIFIGEFSDPDLVYGTHYTTVESIGASLNTYTGQMSSASSEPISIGRFSDPGRGLKKALQIAFRFL